MRRLELLSPAKNLECGIAAIDHGADAVYVGPSRYGARAAAGNSVADIAQLCSYAHAYGAKVYATVNTIIYDDEIEDTRRLMRSLDEAGVDAVLAQDMALVPMAGRMALHASTQTDNRTPDKVAWLGSMGFRRVVLARELSVDEIARIHRECPDVELEAFVHGALCVSYSGLCYASQHCFGRSANRGTCAQFCRMKFDLVDSDGRVLQRQRHLLSLKDLNRSSHLEAMADAGVTSFKIEGRLKDMAYVKNVTAAYSEMLDRVVVRHPDRYERATRFRCRYDFKPDLQKTFNRGYTDYFINGRRGDIASFDTPKAVGEFVGTVKEVAPTWFSVAGVASFSNGDGLCFLNADRQLEGFRVNRADAGRLYPLRMPRGLKKGTRLFRNSSQQMEHLLSRKSSERKMPVAMSLRPVPAGFALRMNDVEATIAAEHVEAVQPQREHIERQLTRLGGTPFECTHVDMADDFNFFIPSSMLSELRRRAVAMLGERMAATGGDDQPRQAHAAAKAPVYTPTYLYNVSNAEARRFYERQGVQAADAFELSEPARALLMQCRHCLRHSLGCCVRHGGRQPAWREPLWLRLGDGRRFRLEFDCARCQMNVYADA